MSNINEIQTNRRQLLKIGAGLAAVAAVPLAMAQGGTASAVGRKIVPSGAVNAANAGKINIGSLTVNRLGFGALKITGNNDKGWVWGEPENKAEVLRVLRRLPELGVDFIDTADAYGPFVSEDLIAEALAPYPQGLVVATKGGFVRKDPQTAPWHELGDPAYLEQCIRMSLRRLKLDKLDLWQLHRVDPKRPAKEQYQAMAKFIEMGLIKQAGLSEVSVAQIKEAQKYFPVASVQNRYNLTYRQHDDVVKYCEENGIAFIPWWPLDNGNLAQADSPAAAVAQAKGISPAQAAIAWLLHKSPAILPIPGTSKVAHLEENIAAASIKLTAAEFAALDKIGVGK
ncbi:MAG: aldo/keto reductase [Neisseria sp.]|nr:aldo/keto reductase [Neisseria sp.]